MTIQSAIQKAVEGGYDFKGYMKKPDAYYDYQKMGELYAHEMLLTIYWHQWDSGKRAVKMSREFWNEQFLLDPSFWQALGKSLENERRWRRPIEVHKGLPPQPAWLFYWHRLIDHLAEGGTIESYFENL